MKTKHSFLQNTWNLKTKVEKLEDTNGIKKHLLKAICLAEKAALVGMMVSNVQHRGNIQLMLENLDNKEGIEQFKKIYPL